jgi:thymidine kinase
MQSEENQKVMVSTGEQTSNLFTQNSLGIQSAGRIELILGCMFAGKSTEMLRRVRKHEITGKKVLIVKFSADMRYSGKCEVVTHDAYSRSATACIEFAHLGRVWQDYEVIGVDEGQFFPDIVEFCEMAANAGKIIIVASLGGTFLRGPFTKILELIPKCEKIKKLAAICKLCKSTASFTFRFASKDDKSMIGGSDKYMPLCRECHRQQSILNKDETFDGNAEETNVNVEMANKDPDAKEAILSTIPNNKSPETPLTTGSNTLSSINSFSPKKDADGEGRRAHLD